MKRTTLKKGILIGLIALLGTVSMNAQSKSDRKEPPSFTELLKQMDKNEDGKLSKNEVKGPLKNDFAKIDTDKNGFISKKELENAPKPKGRPKN
ncbi:EF-hand domain-containing protein [Maribacter sp. ACAM166]|uniref:EF-hand domain-containing protein n=1 Tax=Maribacter sp. ACAM166 TaxID=2508996 RepID=UPI0010FD4BE3|nr:EF-hand domain-containing protein [Maribacter sp. ACAM166]TLP79162.1 EF-hand domain-containing protein [Maribacter sp. ACAM166]